MSSSKHYSIKKSTKERSKEEQIDAIKEFLEECDRTDNDLETYDSEKINEIFDIITGKAKEEYEDSVLNNYAGLYYHKKKSNYKIAKQYYLSGIEKDNSDCMHNLARIYEMESKEKLAEKYYLMAIKKNNVDSMNNLAIMYENQGDEEVGKPNDTNKKYILAEKYFMMAIKQGYNVSMGNLGSLYMNTERNDLALKYFLMGVEHGDNNCYEYIGPLYQEMGKIELAKKYYLLGVDLKIIPCMVNLALLYYQEGDYKSAKTYLEKAIEEDEDETIQHILDNSSENTPDLEEIISKLSIKDASFIEKVEILNDASHPDNNDLSEE